MARLSFIAVVVILALAIAAALAPGRGPNAPTLRDRWIGMKLRVHYDFALGPHRDLQVTVSHGLVTLSGAVGTPEDRRRAAAIARRTGGVVGVVDMLTLETPAHTAPASGPP
ncbi:MAG TPA: BON domain-containing protein [Vicinamibacterales bacterium]|nr:BON domain-containing protein [Vicinamibacterales bacterium]